jgi:hypothetical protein
MPLRCINEKGKLSKWNWLRLKKGKGKVIAVQDVQALRVAKE